MTTIHSRKLPQIGPETACSGLECTVASAVDHALLFGWFGAFFFFALALTFLPRALDRCIEETTRTRAESQAFNQFTQRVTDIEASAPQTVTQQSATGPPVMAFSQPLSDKGLSKVRTVYRETVMAVPHYEIDYDEPLAANITKEFDHASAIALINGNRLTPQLKHTVLHHATTSRDSRRQFLTVLDSEVDSLESAQETLNEVETTLYHLNDRPLVNQSFDDLFDLWDQLRQLKQRIQAVVINRIEEIQTDRDLSIGFADPWSVYHYLYQALGFTHPALAEAARIVDNITVAEHRVIQSMTMRA